MSKDIQGLLFDLDGVLFVGNKPIPGAVKTINWLKKKGYPLLFITNTTTMDKSSIHKKLINLGFPISIEEILTTPEMAVRYLVKERIKSCKLVLQEQVNASFHSFDLAEEHPQAIVIGDIGENWNYSLMNEIFQMVMDGAQMIALHKGRSWRTEKGLQLDIGAFVAGLEYATGKHAVVLGKPSTLFFELALNEIGVPKDHVIMIGDDIENDVAGAKKAGIRGVLVKTGKYHPQYVERSGIIPDDIVESITSVPSLL